MKLKRVRRSLIFKMVLSGGATLFLCLALWTAFNVVYFQQNVLKNVKSDIALLSETILLGLNYAMMLDSEEDIEAIIKNISQHEGIEGIRLLNKKGRIVFSNIESEVGRIQDQSTSSCMNCHQYSPPPASMSLEGRSRIIESGESRVVGIITPIPNEPGCDGGPCHVHSSDEQLLGLLDMEVSTEIKSAMITDFEQANFIISLLVFAATFSVLFIYSYRSIFKPIRRLIQATQGIGSVVDFTPIELKQTDEIGTLARAFNRMGRNVAEKHKQLVAQREEYRDLFQNVPCLVSVVDRNYRVVRYNKAYAAHFGKARGKHCYEINKGRSERCMICPVARTFEDGSPHISEETGLSKDGHVIHWIVYTSPIWNREGEVEAAMEMMLDITARKQLEEQLAASEQRYQAIFEAIPSALFVLDADSLEILNCNDFVTPTFGYDSEEVLGESFLMFFREDEREDWDSILRSKSEISQCSQLTRDGSVIYVSIRLSPAAFSGQKILIASCTDVTKKLEAEQQLIQVSKMTTLGEMAAGVAHELNQPLSILKTISNLVSRKMQREQTLPPAMLTEIADGIETHVDRASKIIEHMREFGRKSDLKTMPVAINKVLGRGFDFFSQQLSVRNIVVHWDLQENLPMIMADANRLEQVIINLLINARDAIEHRWGQESGTGRDKAIAISTRAEDGAVVVRICDTGTGIPDNIRDKLFEPFFTTKDVGKGTGLGLSITYGIVQDYGGTISADNLIEGGACFTVRFPAQA